MLFLNPFMKTKYARGNGETKYKSNDKDIFKDDNVSNDKDIIGSGNAKNRNFNRSCTFTS